MIFTLITRISGFFHVTQHDVADRDTALREHLSRLPADEIEEASLDTARKHISQTVYSYVACHGCKNAWLWLDGTKGAPPILTYIVKTDKTSP
jgi:hypothetical protein